MLKIFLVEDEYVVREGIKKIDWASHGYEFCGEASDGELALPQIGKLQPDIVITDIKMPFMDGLELSRRLRKDYPQIEIVILSGYEEFAYAKEAIALGVSRYLSKPIGANELLEQIDQLRDSIEERKKEKEISEQYLKDMQEDTQKARKDFFNDLVSGTKTVSEILEAAGEFGINLSASCYSVALGILISSVHEQTEFSHTLLNAQQELADWLITNDILYFDRELEGMAAIIMADSEEGLNQKYDAYLAEFGEAMRKYPNIGYYVGIGLPVTRISEIGKSFTSAGKAFAHRYFDTTNNVVRASDRPNISLSDGNEDVSISSIDPRAFERARVQEFIKTGELSECEFFVSECIDNLGEEAIKSNMFRQYIAMDMYFTASEFVSSIGMDASGLPPVDTKLTVAEDSDKVKEYCIKLITEAINLRDSVSHNKYKNIVDSVISYIDENYSDEELSLNTLAEHVMFSPNHLSMIFSQQMGMTLSKYIIEYRISKAKEALKCTSMKSSEIALEIGYKDPHYFSYMFKKITGMTPTQYREGKND